MFLDMLFNGGTAAQWRLQTSVDTTMIIQSCRRSFADDLMERFRLDLMREDVRRPKYTRLPGIKPVTPTILSKARTPVMNSRPERRGLR